MNNAPVEELRFSGLQLAARLAKYSVSGAFLMSSHAAAQSVGPSLKFSNNRGDRLRQLLRSRKVRREVID